MSKETTLSAQYREGDKVVSRVHMELRDSRAYQLYSICVHIYSLVPYEAIEDEAHAEALIAALPLTTKQLYNPSLPDVLLPDFDDGVHTLVDVLKDADVNGSLCAGVKHPQVHNAVDEGPDHQCWTIHSSFSISFGKPSAAKRALASFEKMDDVAKISFASLWCKSYHAHVMHWVSYTREAAMKRIKDTAYIEEMTEDVYAAMSRLVSESEKDLRLRSRMRGLLGELIGLVEEWMDVELAALRIKWKGEHNITRLTDGYMVSVASDLYKISQVLLGSILLPTYDFCKRDMPRSSADELNAVRDKYAEEWFGYRSFEAMKRGWKDDE